MTDDRPEVSVADGRVLGASSSGVWTFRGIPYAAPPVGDLRFAPPQPPESWTGIRSAVDPGPSAPQRPAGYPRVDVAPVTGAEWRRGDEYLTLNVWTPPAAEQRPVMVWVHGGGLALGTKDAPVYDGAGFARSGVVCVAMNYRLGVEGFVPIPGGSTNVGLRDVLAALRWVQDNIRAFGGDPGNVTVFGESGGAMIVSSLVASPAAQGLFRRAIVQSGHGSSGYDHTIAARTAARLAQELSVECTVEALRAAPADVLVRALGKISRPGAVDLRDAGGFNPSFGLSVLGPVIGDDILPTHPLTGLAAGAGRDVDLLIGATADEANFWFVPLFLDFLPDPAARLLLRRVVPHADRIYPVYRRAEPRARGGQRLARILTDLAFRWPACQFAAAHRGRTHVYEFDWRSPAVGGRLGACHGLDLPFVFDTLAVVTGRRGIAGDDPPQALANTVHTLWHSFAADGRLPWPEFTSDVRTVRRLHSGDVQDEPALPVAQFLPDVGS